MTEKRERPGATRIFLCYTLYTMYMYIKPAGIIYAVAAAATFSKPSCNVVIKRLRYYNEKEGGEYVSADFELHKFRVKI